MAQRLAAVSFVLALVSGYFLYAGLTLGVSVPTASGSIANLELMHIQAMQLAIGIGSAISASIFAVGAAIISSRG